MIQAEFKWHAIADGQMTEAEINKSRFSVRANKQKALKKHIHTTIPVNESLQRKAEKSAIAYFDTFYN